MSTCCLRKCRIVGTSTNCSGSCGSLTEVRGGMRYVDNLLGNRREHVEEVEHVHQLFHHQRHRNVKRRHDQRAVDDLHHGAPLISLLRPDLAKLVRPRSPELRHAVTCRAPGGGCFRIFAVQRASNPPPALAVFWLRRALCDTGPTSRL